MSSLSDGFVPPFSPTTMDDSEKTCRVCRSGEEPGNPLYKPCKCSGSISWIHQDCLESWLNVSRTQRCELCKHPFKWEKGAFFSSILSERVLLELGAIVRLSWLTLLDVYLCTQSTPLKHLQTYH